MLTDGHSIKWRRNIAENFSRLRRVHERYKTYRRQTDRRTGDSIQRTFLKSNKMLSYRRETALQGTLVLAESGRLELRDNILLIL